MDNIEVKVEGNILTLKVDLSRSGKTSASGKSRTIATSAGNQTIPDSKGAKFGLNVYRPLN